MKTISTYIIFSILLSFFAFSQEDSNETVVEEGKIGTYIDEGKENINIWKSVVQDVKINGFSFTWLVSLLAVLVGSLTIIAMAIDRVIIPLLIKIVPDEIDQKLLKFRTYLTAGLSWLSKISGWLSFTKTEKK